MRLRDHLEVLLAQWDSDLTPQWRTFFAGTAPDFGAVAPEFQFDSQFPVIPPRSGTPVAGAPIGAHIFRAFDGVSPDAIRVVVIGQDPYPDRRKATGRAFEDGSIASWTGPVAASLKSLLQSASALRLDRPELASGKTGWTQIRQMVAAGSYTLEPIGTLFDRLQKDNGVIFVNAGWTLTRFVSGGSDEQRAHIAMWRPVMNLLLEGLAARPGKATVFLLLGKFAQDLFRATGIEAKARQAGTWQVAIDTVEHPHPNAPGYFGPPNPLERVNRALAGMNGNPVDW